MPDNGNAAETETESPGELEYRRKASDLDKVVIAINMLKQGISGRSKSEWKDLTSIYCPGISTSSNFV